jgi:gamma-glutamylcysteine synthetase
MSSDELLCTRTNWNRVILEGRKPGLTLGKRTCWASTPIGEKGLISSERTSIYSIPPRNSASDGVEYAKIGLEKDGKYLQINSNILQIENELYAPIRPKKGLISSERTSIYSIPPRNSASDGVSPRRVTRFGRR